MSLDHGNYGISPQPENAPPKSLRCLARLRSGDDVSSKVAVLDRKKIPSGKTIGKPWENPYFT